MASALAARALELVKAEGRLEAPAAPSDSGGSVGGVASNLSYGCSMAFAGWEGGGGGGGGSDGMGGRPTSISWTAGESARPTGSASGVATVASGFFCFMTLSSKDDLPTSSSSSSKKKLASSSPSRSGPSAIATGLPSVVSFSGGFFSTGLDAALGGDTGEASNAADVEAGERLAWPAAFEDVAPLVVPGSAPRPAGATRRPS
mmetsp:Transcript_55673/g.103019  ORF Transcript_55673/g.103019 Transcript_55673/m.103019 type:complete len:203 (-) Transcript_55673:184-792(-)